MIGVGAGCIDDPKVADEMKPIMALYVEKKPKWLSVADGADQRNWKHELIQRSKQRNSSKLECSISSRFLRY